MSITYKQCTSHTMLHTQPTHSVHCGQHRKPTYSEHGRQTQEAHTECMPRVVPDVMKTA
eukprot:m.304011 g.304011  ORF g.304011 m.304011 type:complete len:59 (-) comp20172_c1_seq1:1-177(-)